MIKAGKCYCTHCGESFDVKEVLYHAPDNGVYFSINENHELRATPYDLKGGLPQETTWKLAEIVPHKDSGWPKALKLEASWQDQRRTKRMSVRADERICPRCENNGVITRLPRYMGFYDIYSLFVWGAPASGKTTLCKAVSADHTITRINSLLSDTQITPFQVNVDKTMSLPSSVSTTEENAFFVVRSNKHNAVVSIIDLAGELFKMRNEDRAFVDKAQRMMSQFCDLALSLHDPRAIAPSKELAKLLESKEPLSASVLRMRAELLADGGAVPDLINVMVGADELKDACCRQGDGAIHLDKDAPGTYLHDARRKSAYPLLTSSSPLLRQVKSAREIPAHLALARAFFKRGCPQVNEAAAVYNVVISNGSPMEEGEKTFDYTKAMNVDLLMALILNALGLAKL